MSEVASIVQTNFSALRESQGLLKQVSQELGWPKQASGLARGNPLRSTKERRHYSSGKPTL